MTTVLESLSAGLRSSLSESDAVYFLGEDVLDPYGGAFKVARGLSTAFPERVITSPVSEAGLVGVALGMALRGLRPIVEIMFGDFTLLAADQLINHAAKVRWLSGGAAHAPMVVRTPMGGRRGYGPTHSQTLEKHFLGAPGLRVVAASALGDPGAMLRAAVLEDDDPVLFIENKSMYPIAVQPTTTLEGFEVCVYGRRYPTYQLRVAGAPASTATLAAYGLCGELARQAALRLAFEDEIFTDVFIFTELSPHRPKPLHESLFHTRRLLTIEEGTRALGWGAEVLAQAVEGVGPGLQCRRVAALDMPVPSAATLEAVVLPGVDTILSAARALVGRS